MPLTKQQHLDRTNPPKRILALDGGGIRGILTLEYLGVIEGLLRERSGKPDLRLCDYFDLIGGTSTGSIIAAGLACGMSVERLELLYREVGESVFQGKLWRKGFLVPKFPSEPVRQALARHLGADTCLDSERIRTGLMIMTKRLDTGSPWPLHNHPDAPYAAQDGRLLLPEVVRASTAAPTYFEPERITLSARDGKVLSGAFVDGGVSPFNDPALQLLMLAALQGHGFRWPAGKDKLLLISVGTGIYKQTFKAEELLRMTAAEQGLRALQSLMDDCARVNQSLLQWLTDCLTPWTIDRAVQDMRLDSRAGPKLATYARYNVLLEAGWLKTEIRIDQPPGKLAEIAAMDNPANMDELAEIGRLAAAKQVKPEHFPATFDIE
ncbi:MAG TPA: patatin-like phospholipase family protein [Candidatus Acidoferrales bacterium]|nr:patatin-like phospholipase family protein [Candidatus Acidoferrales bacterium]